MRSLTLGALLFALLTSVSVAQPTQEFFQKAFEKRDGCFLMVDLKSGNTIHEFNRSRCKKRFPPCSTFKIPLSAMAFDSKYFKNVNQKLKWDGKKRSRKAVNQDQTPETFMRYSVIWVSRLIVSHLGQKRVQDYVNKFQYGNKTVEGNLKSFWLSEGSIKISAKEQTDFLQRLWNGELGLSKKALEQTKKVAVVKNANNRTVYGKTGTGCIDKGCMSKPGRQLGWFVGVLQNNENSYSFALNYSDKTPTTGYAGPRAKKIVLDFLDRHHSAKNL